MAFRTTWVYLSPHLDDVAYSCGGMIWEQIRFGTPVEIWTIFAGDPPRSELTPFARSLHTRWQSGDGSAAARRREDMAACGVLQAGFRHFNYPDCIYRRELNGQPVINREEDLFRADYPGESELSLALAEVLRQELPSGAILAIPYGFGDHIDHQLIKRTTALLDLPQWAYADYPYAAQDPANLQTWLNQPGETLRQAVSGDALEHWKQAVTAYQTQISTFWKSVTDLREKIEQYSASGVGSVLRRVR